MLKYLLAFIFFISSCETDNEDQRKSFPINPNEVTYKKGDCLAFKIDSGKIVAGIVMNISKDEDGVSYGICFTDYIDTLNPSLATIKLKRIFGRKIESTVDTKGYFVGLDFDYLSDSCIKSSNKKIQLIGNIKIDSTKIEVGSESATGDYSQFIQQYKIGHKRRLSPPDNYREQLKLNNFRPDEYFPIINFILN